MKLSRKSLRLILALTCYLITLILPPKVKIIAQSPIKDGDTTKVVKELKKNNTRLDKLLVSLDIEAPAKVDTIRTIRYRSGELYYLIKVGDSTKLIPKK